MDGSGTTVREAWAPALIWVRRELEMEFWKDAVLPETTALAGIPLMFPPMTFCV